MIDETVGNHEHFTYLQFLEQQQAAVDPAGTHGTTVINRFGGTSLRSKLQLDLRHWNDDDIPISESGSWNSAV